jgi:iron complex outermembrane recepter protein
MSIKMKKMTVLVQSALGVGIAASLVGLPAYAQQDVEKVEKIEVTGSSIRRIQAEGALPVQVITRKDIEKSGAATVTDLIQAIPAMQGFTTNADSVNGGGGGVATASLRSIGANNSVGASYTLVLLNGRRVASSNSGSEVNLNTLPLSAIERVEVLTDGASAIYGADAIAGVVNFITRKSSGEGNIEVSTSQPQRPGASNYSISGSKGFGDLDKDGYNIMGSFSFDEQEQLNALDRSFSRSGKIPFTTPDGKSAALVLDSINSVPGNISVTSKVGGLPLGAALPGASFNPYLLSTGACPAQTFKSGNVCRFDFASTVQLVPESSRSTFFLSGRTKLTDSASLFAEYMRGDYWTEPRFAPPAQPLPLLSKDRATGAVTFQSPFYAKYVLPNLAKFGIDPATVSAANMNLRIFDAGGRQDRYKYTTNHLVVGGDAAFLGWDATTSLTQSTTAFEQTFKGGFLSGNAFDAIIANNAYDPFLLAGSSAAALAPAVLKGNVTNDKYSLTDLSVKGSRPLFNLSGGDAAVGTGLAVSRQRYESNPSAISQGANSLQPDFTDVIIGGGQGFLPFDTKRNVVGIFAELAMPFTKEFEVTGAVRRDSYSAAKNAKNFDASGNLQEAATQGNKFDATTYKIGGRLQPNKTVLVRASYGTGFRAPTLGNITAPLTDGGSTGREYDCPFPVATDPLNAGCQSAKTQYNLLTGGNALTGESGLKAEKSKQWNLGFRVEPTSALSFGVDFWNISLTDQIAVIPESLAFENPETYRGLFIVRPDTISKIPYVTLLQTPINLTASNYRGLDFDAATRFDSQLGKMGFRVAATRLLKAEYEIPGTSGFQNSLGKYGPDQTVGFKWIVKLTANLDHGDFAHSLTANYKSGYTDSTITTEVDANGDPVVDADGNEAPTNGPNVRYINADGSLGGTVLNLVRKVPSYTTFDWQTKYTVSKQVDVTAGIRNMFDRLPPLSIQDGGSGNQRGFDPRYTDVVGRTFYLKAGVKF